MEKQTKFPDVKAGHWAELAIKAVSDAGIIKGLPDGTFAPDKPLTRAEMAVIVAKLIK
ncbi:S-layer homology domain-containing protein [Cohnella terricola]|uniref:S-layer homology domain-containing protein n=1 Tax=Cohnella terricola TaxID=1289167 RepID=UPI001FE3E4BC|nr:S-layer homology domain-containing protein [Cohnella terricola]